jgi:hypothetical protein
MGRRWRAHSSRVDLFAAFVGSLVAGEQCNVCKSGMRPEIDAELARGLTHRAVALKFGVSKDSVRRHARFHLGLKPSNEAEVSRAVTLARYNAIGQDLENRNLNLNHRRGTSWTMEVPMRQEKSFILLWIGCHSPTFLNPLEVRMRR